MLLHLCTWAEVESYLGNRRDILLPIGSTEQHGPNGMIGTDAITAEAVAHRVGDATGALVGPTLPIGMAVHHMAFAGTMTLRPSTLIALVDDCLESLARHGFRRIMFVNGHGGNIAPLRAAFFETHQRRAAAGLEELRCSLVCWWENEPVSRLSRELFGNAEGSHATPSEVSMVQYLHPEAVRNVAMPPANASSGFHGPQDFRRRYPDGRMASNPGLATPEHGERFLATAVAAVTEQYRRFVDEG